MKKTSEWGSSKKLGTDVHWFAVKQNFEGDTLGSHVTADVSTSSQKIFFQKMYTNYVSFDSKFNAIKRLQ